MITMSVGYRKNPCIQVQDRLDTMAVVPQRVGLPASHVLDSHQSQGLPVGMALAEFQLKSLLFATPSIFCNTRFLCNLFPCNTFQACSTFRFFTPLGLGCNALFYFFCILRFQYLEAHVFLFFSTPLCCNNTFCCATQYLYTSRTSSNILPYLEHPCLFAPSSLFAIPSLSCNAFYFATPFPICNTSSLQRLFLYNPFSFETHSLICNTLPYLQHPPLFAYLQHLPFTKSYCCTVYLITRHTELAHLCAILHAEILVAGTRSGADLSSRDNG